jgi:hypothetical protein
MTSERDTMLAWSGVVLMVGFAVALFSAVTPLWLMSNSGFGVAATSPFYASFTDSAVLPGGSASTTGSTAIVPGRLPWLGLSALQPCSDEPPRNASASGSMYEAWGAPLGFCAAPGQYSGTPSVVVAMQAMTVLACTLTFSAAVMGLVVNRVRRGGRGYSRTKHGLATLLVALLACVSATSAFSLALGGSSNPWYSGLRFGQGVLPLVVVSNTGEQQLEAVALCCMRLGPGWSSMVACSILSLIASVIIFVAIVGEPLEDPLGPEFVTRAAEHAELESPFEPHEPATAPPK